MVTAWDSAMPTSKSDPEIPPKPVQTGALRHGGGNSHQLWVFFGQFHHGIAKNLGISGVLRCSL